MSLATATERDRVGPYRLVKAIGAGGSARVDLARIDRAYGFVRHVVIKRPLEHLRGDPAVAASLRREAQIGGRLRHPNLVAVLDAGMHDGYDYLVLEYVHGSSLRALMQTETPGAVRELPLAVALSIVIDTARGLHDAHELTGLDGAPLGLVHRDVSPGNVLIGLDGTVKLSDFGIAKDTRVNTLSGSMRGTVTYMAPEQCRGHAFDRRADVFSLGVILYELVTGTRLFWADNDVASLHRVLSGTVPAPRTIKPELAPELDAIMMTALAHAPERRLATARQLADALEKFAAAAGVVTGARRIAKAMDQADHARQVPWITAHTIPDPARPEHSLVALIEAVATDDAVDVAFGPTDLALIDEPEPPVAAPPMASSPELSIAERHGAARAHRRPRLIALIAVALAAIGATVLVMNARRTTGSADPAETAPGGSGAAAAPASFTELPRSPFAATAPPAPGATPPPSPSSPGAATATPSSSATPPPGAPASPSPGPTSTTPDHAPATAPGTPPPPPPPPHGAPPHRPHRVPHGPAHAPITAGAGSTAAAPTTAPSAGSGSATKPPATVEWKPTLLLPTDVGSGTKK